MIEGTLRRPWRLRRGTGKVRAVLALGMLFGVTQVGTMASWNDTATVTTGGFATGSLDLVVGETAANQLTGQGGSWTQTSLALGTMAPGESVARLMRVGNGGSVALSYNGAVASTNNNLYNTSTPGLQLTITKGATTATNTGTQAAASRSGSCDGTATAMTNLNVNTTASNINAAATTLAAGDTTTYCVVARLATSAPNSMQNQSTNLTFTFNAAQ